jgi:hypothetical protein
MLESGRYTCANLQVRRPREGESTPTLAVQAGYPVLWNKRGGLGHWLIFIFMNK